MHTVESNPRPYPSGPQVLQNNKTGSDRYQGILINRNLDEGAVGLPCGTPTDRCANPLSERTNRPFSQHQAEIKGSNGTINVQTGASHVPHISSMSNAHIESKCDLESQSWNKNIGLSKSREAENHQFTMFNTESMYPSRFSLTPHVSERFGSKPDCYWESRPGNENQILSGPDRLPFRHDTPSAHDGSGYYSGGSPRHGRAGQHNPKLKAPIFNGRYSEWPYFKRLFLEAASINAWSEREVRYHLLRSVEDEAKTFIISIDKQIEGSSLANIFAIMEQRFGETNGSHHYQSLLESKAWRQGDSLRLYVDEIRRLVSLAYHEVPNLIQQESLVRKHFVNGITDMTLKHKMLVDPPASVETAVQYAERYVAAIDCMSKQKPV